MRKAQVFQKSLPAGVLEELGEGRYRFTYEQDYGGDPVSLAMPATQLVYEFDRFPPVFEGLLPEGYQLDALLRRNKIDRTALCGQLWGVGKDVGGSLTITEEK